jgi:hypothetical protein
VDSRLLITLAAMAATEPVDIVSFGDAGPGAGPGTPLRTADIQPARPAPDLPVEKPLLQYLLRAERNEYPAVLRRDRPSGPSAGGGPERELQERDHRRAGGAGQWPDVGLTCHRENQANVFYVSSTDNLIHVLIFENPDDPDILDFAMDGTHPVPGSALTCFALPGGIGTRLYYPDDQYRVNEMAWTDDTMVNHLLPATALPGSALTCFGVGGQYTCLYYLDHQARVNELGWSNGRWANHVLPGTAAPHSALTCFGVDGTFTRLYYLDAQSRINELAWQTNRFVNSVL